MTERIERQLSLDAPVEDVWVAIISDGWLADEVELQLQPGGEARFRCGPSVRTGWIEEALAPFRLAFWWAPDDEPASRVELTLEQRLEGGTRLRVAETRPLDVLDLVGVPLRSLGGAFYGPALVAA